MGTRERRKGEGKVEKGIAVKRREGSRGEDKGRGGRERVR